ncbi:hypothetical protein COCC4DRAFT_205842, partial [Bipolaris maydis ATCC 48331]
RLSWIAHNAFFLNLVSLCLSLAALRRFSYGLLNTAPKIPGPTPISTLAFCVWSSDGRSP